MLSAAALAQFESAGFVTVDVPLLAAELDAAEASFDVRICSRCVGFGSLKSCCPLYRVSHSNEILYRNPQVNKHWEITIEPWAHDPWGLIVYKMDPIFAWRGGTACLPLSHGESREA
jgi:hypothetical protein